jgi:hypothetical protein
MTLGSDNSSREARETSCGGGVTVSPLHLEARLDWVIESTRLRRASPRRRLYAIENSLASLAEPWRRRGPLDSVRDVRMSEATLRAMIGWLLEGGTPGHDFHPRLCPYLLEAVVSPTVGDGWVRVLLSE